VRAVDNRRQRQHAVRRVVEHRVVGRAWRTKGSSRFHIVLTASSASFHYGLPRVGAAGRLPEGAGLPTYCIGVHGFLRRSHTNMNHGFRLVIDKDMFIFKVTVFINRPKYEYYTVCYSSICIFNMEAGLLRACAECAGVLSLWCCVDDDDEEEDTNEGAACERQRLQTCRNPGPPLPFPYPHLAPSPRTPALLWLILPSPKPVLNLPPPLPLPRLMGARSVCGFL